MAPDHSAPGADRIRVRYRLETPPDQADQLARAIAVEQTVEIPDRIIPPRIRREVVGEVESLTRAGPAATEATISYPPEFAGNLSELLGVLYGNASMLTGVRVVDFEPPISLLERLSGPNHGVLGLRRLRGIHGRPLVATALKPRGSSNEELAALAAAFARGGGDLVKDDQNLNDDFVTFRARVLACAHAVDRANEATGSRCLYLPHAGAPAEELERYVAFVAEAGLPGVLVCPMLVGLDAVRMLAARYPLVFMAHPSFSGAFTNAPGQGISHGVLLGTLFRLAGADISVYPGPRGRFGYPEAAVRDIQTRLRAPLGGLRRAWPSPAGGLACDEVTDAAVESGRDAVLLIGGALLSHPFGLEDGARALLDGIRAEFGETAAPPEPMAAAEADGPSRLAFESDWQWTGRPGSPYKDAGDLAFRGVRRVELVGRFGERSGSDLRYFEVEPGGYTSHERHLHTHVVIGARGEGVLVLDGRRMPLRPHDIACVGPLESHQLRNETDHPFGFYCVVDHHRDPPMPPRDA